MLEEWRDIKGYEGRYQVSEWGRVRSLPNVVQHMAGKAGDTPCTRRVGGRILAQAKHPSGHRTVALGFKNTKKVHHLVLETFVGPRPPEREALHLDHNPTNNAVFNLWWGTRSENLLMDYTSGSRMLVSCRARRRG